MRKLVRKEKKRRKSQVTSQLKQPMDRVDLALIDQKVAVNNITANVNKDTTHR